MLSGLIMIDDDAVLYGLIHSVQIMHLGVRCGDVHSGKERGQKCKVKAKEDVFDLVFSLQTNWLQWPHTLPDFEQLYIKWFGVMENGNSSNFRVLGCKRHLREKYQSLLQNQEVPSHALSWVHLFFYRFSEFQLTPNHIRCHSKDDQPSSRNEIISTACCHFLFQTQTIDFRTR